MILWRICVAGSNKMHLGQQVKSEVSRQTVTEVPSISFHGNPSGWCRAGTCGQAGRQADGMMDMTKLTDNYSDTSVNEDNSFRNHIRQPKRDLPQVSIENRLICSGCCPLFKDKFYKIVKSTL